MKEKTLFWVIGLNRIEVTSWRVVLPLGLGMLSTLVSMGKAEIEDHICCYTFHTESDIDHFYQDSFPWHR